MTKRIPYDKDTVERLSISTGLSKKVIISYWNELTKNHNLATATQTLKDFFLVIIKREETQLLKKLGFGRNSNE